MQINVILHNDVKRQLSEKAGVFIMDDYVINGRKHWISPNGYAIWNFKDVWFIGSTKYLGTDISFMVLLFPVQCPHQANGKWKFWNGNNFVDAGNNIQVKQSKTGT